MIITPVCYRGGTLGDQPLADIVTELGMSIVAAYETRMKAHGKGQR